MPVPNAAARLAMPLAEAAQHYAQGRSLIWIASRAEVAEGTLRRMLLDVGVVFRAAGTRVQGARG